MSRRAQASASIHCGVFFALFAAILLAFPRIGWPWHFVVPLALYAIVVRYVPRLQRSIPPRTFGRVDWSMLGFALLVAVGSSGVLLAFDDFYWPNVDELAAGVPLRILGSAGLASIVFAVTNAVCEELVFRWLFWEAVAEEWNQSAALFASSVMFGLAHWQGYPPGPIGAPCWRGSTDCFWGS